MSWKETLTPLDFNESDPLPCRCVCCGGKPSLWEVDRDGTVTKMVNCETASVAEAVGEVDEADGFSSEYCPLYMPAGMMFNKATRREAINYWNKFNEMLAKLREQNRELG